MLTDIRVALRHLLKARGYTIATVATLALAIGATSAIFSAVYAVLLHPLPIQRPEELVICWGTDPARNQAVVELSHQNFTDWARAARSFDRMAATSSSPWPVVMEGRGEPVRLGSAGVSAGFFETLGATPLIGRTFTPDDDQPNAARVAILSYGTWTQRFGSDPHVVGTTLQLDERLHTIVGVMPRGFDFPRGVDLWTPVVPVLSEAGRAWGNDAIQKVGVLYVLGRLRDGVSPVMAAEELDTIARTQEEAGIPRFGTSIVVTPFLDHFLGPVRQALWWLFGAVGVLLFIACANVSGLMLTRVTQRQREHAVRLALGATRARIGRLWAAETAILVLAGGAAGLAAAGWIASAVVALAPPDVSRLSEIAIDVRVAGFTLLVMSLCALVCGAAPVVHAGRLKPADTLKDAAHGGGRSLRARSALATIQIALAVFLLIGAGLIVRSFTALRQIDVGFNPSGVLAMTVDPRDAKPSGNRWIHELLARVERLPGVVASGAVFLRPLALGPIGQGTWVLAEGQPASRETVERNPTLNYQIATPGYFQALQIPLLSGRLFDDRDDERSERVALVSESTARRLWPGENPIGKRLLMPSFSPDNRSNIWRRVVGVVGDVRYRGLEEVQFDVYDAPLQAVQTASHIVVKTTGDPMALAAAVRHEARQLDAGVLVENVATMDSVLERALAPWRFSSWLFACFASLAFALATVGLFSLVNLDSSARSREFAIRLALGARPRDILRNVISPAASRVLIGVAAGLLAAVVSARWLRTLLAGIDAFDPITYAGVVLLVSVVVGLASYLPARRAAATHPADVLKIV